MCRLVLLHLLWVLPSACLLLLSLVCELVSVCPFWSRSLTVPQLCCSLLPGWACGARCYLSFWSRSDGICCGELLLTMLLCHLVQASYYLRARTHYVGYCLILLFAHPAFWITCFWSIFTLWHLVSSAWSRAAVMSASISILNPVLFRINL